MIQLLLGITLVLGGQIPFYGDIPRDVPTYEMRFPDGTEAHGALWMGDDWYREESVRMDPGQRPTIIYDTPWNPRRDRVMRLPEFSLEPPVLRQSRLEREWEANGYGPVETPDGTMYYPSQEIALAERAEAMAKSNRIAAGEGETLANRATHPTAAAPPGLIEQWGLHLLAGAVGLGLTMFVFWRMVLQAR